MKIEFETLGPCRLKATVTATAEEVDPTLKGVRADFTKSARVPGFRPGKAPWANLRKLFGEQIDREEAKRVSRQLIDAMRNDLDGKQKRRFCDLVGMELGDVGVGKGASATIEVDVEPEFDLPDVSAWQVAKLDLAVPEDVVKAQLDQLRRQATTFRAGTAEDTIAEGDLVGFAFASDLNAEAEPEAVKPFVSSAERWEQVKADASGLLPGDTAALVGKRLGEEVPLEVTFPADFRVAELAGRTVHYTLTVKSLRKPEQPTDEDLAKRCGMENMEALDKAVREHLAQARAAQAHDEAERAIAEKISASVSFDLPESEVRRRTYDMLQQDPSDPLKDLAGKSHEEVAATDVYKQTAERAAKSVRLGYVLRAWANKNDVKVEGEEFNAHLNRLANQMDMKPDMAFRRLIDNGRLGDFSARLQEEKALNKLVDVCAVL